MKKRWIIVAIAVVLFVIAEIVWIQNRDGFTQKEHTGEIGSMAHGESDAAAYGSGAGLHGDGSGTADVEIGPGTSGGADATLESTGENNLEYLQEKQEELLQNSSSLFTAGYPLDETFFQWFLQNYGAQAFEDICEYAGNTTGEEQDAHYWYERTGRSIHVLWLEYCSDRQYATYQLSNVVWKECADAEEIVIDIVGDINFAEDWYTMEAYKNRQNDLNQCISEEIQQELQHADITLLNNEFTYSEGGAAVAGKAYTFRANPDRVELLSALGCDIVSLANNHTYDYGEEALCDTIDTLEQVDIAYVGAGRNLGEAEEIRYFVANGRKIAVVAATQIEKFSTYTKEATAHSAGVLKTLNPERFCAVIQRAKAHSDYVIAYVHWGTEGMLYIEEDQRALARAYVEAGADVIVGNHSHRLQGIEYIQGVPVLHSLGNFWFSTGSLYTAIAQLRIGEDGALAVSYLPCMQKDMTVTMLEKPDEVEDFYRYLADISESVGIAEDGIIYDMEVWQEQEGEKFVYLSNQKYEERTGAYDLENRRINIVGNLVNN